MAKVKGKLVDRNRLVKKYSYVRAPKNLSYIGDKNLEIEAVQVSFNNESRKEVKFEFPFKSTDYQVALTPRQTASESADSASVSLAVIASSITLTGFTISASAPFTGEVDVLIIKISESV
jgi:hypothetical protein